MTSVPIRGVGRSRRAAGSGNSTQTRHCGVPNDARGFYSAIAGSVVSLAKFGCIPQPHRRDGQPATLRYHRIDTYRP